MKFINKLIRVANEFVYKNYCFLKCRNFLQHYRNFLKQSDGEFYRLRMQLAGHPRFQEGLIDFRGLKIKHVDAASLLSGIQTVYIDEVYKWNFIDTPKYILDCGANIGLSAMYFSRLYPSCKIMCFEPDATLFSVLTQNLQSNECTNVHPVSSALGKYNGYANFHFDGADGGKLVQPSDESQHGSTVRIEKLSDYIHETVDLIKMDIEGEELSVLTEIESVLHKTKRIVFEYHCFELANQTLHTILDFLHSHDFLYSIEKVEDCPGLNKEDYTGERNTLIVRACQKEIIGKHINENPLCNIVH